MGEALLHPGDHVAHQLAEVERLALDLDPRREQLRDIEERVEVAPSMRGIARRGFSAGWPMAGEERPPPRPVAQRGRSSTSE